jgi:hypothetical protein
MKGSCGSSSLHDAYIVPASAARASPARLFLRHPTCRRQKVSPEQRSGLYAGSRIWRFRVRDPLGSDTPGGALVVRP